MTDNVSVFLRTLDPFLRDLGYTTLDLSVLDSAEENNFRVIFLWSTLDAKLEVLLGTMDALASVHQKFIKHLLKDSTRCSKVH